jgi:hypothetical protein
MGGKSSNTPIHTFACHQGAPQQTTWQASAGLKYPIQIPSNQGFPAIFSASEKERHNDGAKNNLRTSQETDKTGQYTTCSGLCGCQTPDIVSLTNFHNCTKR